MSYTKAKTINLLLYEGNLDGLIYIEDSLWNSGELYSAPSDSIEDLFMTDAFNKHGIYLLLSNDNVFIGHSSDLSKDIPKHIRDSNWWDRIVILTTKEDIFNHTDINYLETRLIRRATSIEHLNIKSQNKEHDIKIDKFRQVFLDQYIEEALFLIQLIGITTFKNTLPKTNLDTIDISTKLAFGKRAKQEAIKYVTQNNIYIGKLVTYAIRSEEKDEFWANPNLKCLLEEWWMILNNNIDRKLFVLKIPANSFHIKSKYQDGLLARKDNPEKLDLNINTTSFIDRKSQISFKPFILHKLKY